MKLKLQKRLASKIMKCSPKRVWLNPDSLSTIKEAITRNDIKGLIRHGVIDKLPERGVSRGRARLRSIQKKKGRQKSVGTRKGTRNARFPAKDEWMNKIRKQRAFIKELKSKDLIETSVAKDLYQKAKGGYFRSKGHLKLYINEHKMIK
ncbi:50S ribosomal protein L19e [Candidatus Woesearchaeota archaeon]|nr:50S ribosomal protein L19e [Candidatus Woesearchaeota archaeon]